MLAVNHFYQFNQQGLHCLNEAYVVLVPKKANPERMYYFRPISLSHSFAKIISKLLANRLDPELHHLLSSNQMAFIKTRCIHDNFVFVQQIVKGLHRKKIPIMFIKLDISKAFDTVNWPYLLSIMAHLGFGLRWINWISSLWGTSSSCYLLNGEPKKRILRCRGVRQGDPLSPILFLLAMEPLHKLFKKAKEVGLLSKVSKSCDNFRISLYADDAALLIKPTPDDLRTTSYILDIFAGASGLKTTMEKAKLFPIQCGNISLEFLSQNNLAISSFSCNYLGLPFAH
jgi:hypothetical protein